MRYVNVATFLIITTYVSFSLFNDIKFDLISTAKANDDITELLKEMDASLAKIDDATLLQRYGAEGSGLNIEGISDKGSGLNIKGLGGIPLMLQSLDVVSNVSSIEGVSSISSDSSGFGFTVALSGDYLFDFDKDTLLSKALEALDKVYVLYQEHDGTNILIEGHTDSKGSNDYNLDLSERRASSVREWFLKKQIATNLITIKGYGETKPAAPNKDSQGKDNPDGRAKNRRVELVIKTTKKVNQLPVISDETSFK